MSGFGKGRGVNEVEHPSATYMDGGKGSGINEGEHPSASLHGDGNGRSGINDEHPSATCMGGGKGRSGINWKHPSAMWHFANSCGGKPRGKSFVAASISPAPCPGCISLGRELNTLRERVQCLEIIVEGIINSQKPSFTDMILRAIHGQHMAGSGAAPGADVAMAVVAGLRDPPSARGGAVLAPRRFQDLPPLPQARPGIAGPIPVNSQAPPAVDQPSDFRRDLICSHRVRLHEMTTFDATEFRSVSNDDI